MSITLVDSLLTLLIVSTKCDSFKLLKYENQSSLTPLFRKREQEERAGRARGRRKLGA